MGGRLVLFGLGHGHAQGEGHLRRVFSELYGADDSLPRRVNHGGGPALVFTSIQDVAEPGAAVGGGHANSVQAVQGAHGGLEDAVGEIEAEGGLGDLFDFGWWQSRSQGPIGEGGDLADAGQGRGGQVIPLALFLKLEDAGADDAVQGACLFGAQRLRGYSAQIALDTGGQQIPLLREQADQIVEKTEAGGPNCGGGERENQNRKKKSGKLCSKHRHNLHPFRVCSIGSDRLSVDFRYGAGMRREISKKAF